MRPALAAVEFLTRVRVRRGAAASLDEIAASQAWFPAVGLLIGAALLAIDRVAMRALPRQPVDVLLVVALAAITGALHLDGLGDAADGLFGGQTAERRLAIMRDPRAGTFAIVAVAGVLAMKWAGFDALPSAVRVEAIVLAPCLSRFAMLITTAAFPYARPQGMGAGFRAPARRAAVIGGATAAVAAVALLGAGGLYALGFAAACGWGIGWYATRLCGGVTGDIYGASVEVSEAATLLFIAGLASHGWIDALLFG